MASSAKKASFSADSFFYLILAAGVALRLSVVPFSNGLGGDPVFSYGYRALLLSHGVWSGLFKMWHPPGYPVILALLHTLTLRRVPPYYCGIALSILSYAGLAILMDRRFGRRLEPTARLFLAGALAFWETMFFWQTVPVTEPPYALLLYGSMALLLANEKLRGKTFFLAGCVLGLGGTLRREAAPAFLGMAAWVFWDASRSKKPRWKSVAAFAGGYLLLSGWTFLDPRLLEHMKAQEFSYTVPAAKGFGANLLRAVECFYRACVDWLPEVLLLPYWLFVSAGLFFHWADKRWERAHALFAASLLPALAAVTLTIQHKRTGFFLLPAAALYFALGADLLFRPFESRWPRWRPFAVGALGLVLAIEPLRMFWYVQKRPIRPETQVTRIQGEMAKRYPMGKIWAFGNEPEIYYHANWPVDYPFDERDEYAKLYSNHTGNPKAFVARLKSEGIRYLAFSISDTKEGVAAHQRPYENVAPLQTDLVDLMSLPSVKLQEQAPIADPAGHVYFLEIL